MGLTAEVTGMRSLPALIGLERHPPAQWRYIKEPKSTPPVPSQYPMRQHEPVNRNELLRRLEEFPHVSSRDTGRTTV